MNEDWIDILNILPSWMIFVLLLLLITVPLIAEGLRTFRLRKEYKNNKIFIDQVKDHQSNVYKTLNVLLDIMYERYSNNLSFDISIRLINIVYIRASYYITEHIFNYYKNDELKNKEIDISDLQDQLRIYVENIYHEDILILNKIRCKGVALDIHLSNHVSGKQITDKILSIISQVSKLRKSKNILLTKECIHREINNRTKSYFYTLVNKAQKVIELEICKQPIGWNK